MKSFASALLALLLLAILRPAFAQPTLSSLWPMEVGRDWEFDASVEGPFTQVRTGSVRQTVVGQTQLGSEATVWCFDVVSTMSPPQPAMLLAVPDCDLEVGVFVDDSVAMGVWSEGNTDWAWWWVPADLTPGAAFRLPIRRSLVDDAFLNGVVRTLDGAVTTPLSSFTGAVIIDYVVELGETEIHDGGGDVLGTVSFESVGWVAFVPDVGPVASSETFAPAEMDCPDCPPVVFETITTTMQLRATTSVSTERPTFGSVKARY